MEFHTASDRIRLCARIAEVNCSFVGQRSTESSDACVSSANPRQSHWIRACATRWPDPPWTSKECDDFRHCTISQGFAFGCFGPPFSFDLANQSNLSRRQRSSQSRYPTLRLAQSRPGGFSGANPKISARIACITETDEQRSLAMAAQNQQTNVSNSSNQQQSPSSTQTSPRQSSLSQRKGSYFPGFAIARVFQQQSLLSHASHDPGDGPCIF